MTVADSRQGPRSIVSTGPLAGLLVLDFGQAAVGPVAASYMAMLGATVIKVEPPRGDSVRYGKPTMRGTGTTFIGNNIGKFGVCLDLKSPEDRQVALDLIALSDVIIDNFRSPSVMSRLGLDYFAVLEKLNPRLVYLQASAFGGRGPWSESFSFEWIAQAVSGFAGATGAKGGEPEFSRGTACLDWTGAMVNLIVMLAGLLYRERHGRGLMLATSQYSSAVFSGMTRLLETNAGSFRHGSQGIGVAPDRAFRSSDGYIAVCAPTDAIWRRLCLAIDRSDWMDRADRARACDRMTHRETIEADLEEVFAAAAAEVWVERLRMARVPCALHHWSAPMTERLLGDEQVIANGCLEWQDSPFGKVLSQAPHWTFKHHQVALRRPSPRLGEHNQLVTTLLARAGASVGASLERPETAPARRDAVSYRFDALAHDRVLDGVKVIELGTGLPVAAAGMVLRQLGAVVTKVEPPWGDWLRQWGGTTDDSPLWRIVTRGKKLERIDLTTDGGQRTLGGCLRDVDVVVAAGPTASRRRLHVDYERVKAENPAAIYCGLSGWGTQGPLADQPATEFDLETMAGMTLQLGSKGEHPVRLGFDLVSVNTGFAAVQGILAALYSCGLRGDCGEHVEISMLQTAIAIMQWNTTAESGPDSYEGRQLEAYEWPPDHGYQCADRRVLISLRGDEEAWSKFFVALGRLDLLTDPRFQDLSSIRQHEQLLPGLLRNQLSQWSYDRLRQFIEEMGGAVLPVLEPHEVLHHPQTQALEFVDLGEGGELRAISLAISHVVNREPLGQASAWE